MNLCGDDRTTILLIMFAVGGINYFFFIYKAYKHSNNKGYNPTFPIGLREDYSKFLKECSTNYKKHEDSKLKKYYILLHASFTFCVVIILYLVFT